MSSKLGLCLGLCCLGRGRERGKRAQQPRQADLDNQGSWTWIFARRSHDEGAREPLLHSNATTNSQASSAAANEGHLRSSRHHSTDTWGPFARPIHVEIARSSYTSSNYRAASTGSRVGSPSQSQTGDRVYTSGSRHRSEDLKIAMNGAMPGQNSQSLSPGSPEYQIHPRSIDDDTIPVEITVKVGKEVFLKELSLSPSSDDAYSKIEEASNALIKNKFPDLQPGEQIRFLDGDCFMSLEGSPSTGFSPTMRLQSDQQWPPIKNIVLRMWRSNRHRVVLKINRTYLSPRRSSVQTKSHLPPVWDWLLGELRERRKLAEPNGRFQYIARADLDELITEKIIQEIVSEDETISKEEKSSFTETICKHKAHKLLALFVYKRHDLRFLRELLGAGYCDDKLPLNECPQFWRGWNASPFEDLFGGQWLFLAPVFENNQHLELHGSIPIPLLLKEECGEGAFSMVYKIQIEPSHQQVYRLAGNRNPFLALKVLRDLHKLGDRAFENEQSMLRELCRMQHRHIVRLLCTYKHDNIYHMVFPHANCNLRHYFKVKNPPRLEKSTIIWFVSQLIGLTDALNRIHKYKISDPRLVEELDRIYRSKAPGLEMPLPEEDDIASQTGYHHDLKPENILHFDEVEDEVPKLGVFQIADFGLAQFHSIRSGSQNPARKVGTAAYRAPEDDMGEQISRPYDVWSLGCIFLEMLTWLLKGIAGVSEFSQARMQTVVRDYKDDAFFIIQDHYSKSRVPLLRDSVVRWIEDLRQDSACNNTSGSKGYLSDTLSLIEKMLEVDKNKRLRTNDCLREWDKIIAALREMPDESFLSVSDGESSVGEPFTQPHETQPQLVITGAPQNSSTPNGAFLVTPGGQRRRSNSLFVPVPRRRNSVSFDMHAYKTP